MKKIVLASASPYRKQVLQKFGLNPIIHPSDYEEDMSMTSDPAELAKTLSAGKADDVAKRYDDAIIIGADTFIVFEDEFLGKPKDAQQAKQMWQRFSGNVQYVYSGYSIIDTLTQKQISKVVVSEVFFQTMSDEDIDYYISQNQWQGKAGGYSISMLAGQYIQDIKGDYYAIIGLPVSDMARTLQKDFGYNILD